MKCLKTLLVVSVLTLPLQAEAQWAVFDGANFGQNILIAARTLQQVNNQVRELTNQAQMLANDARNLTSLPFSVLGELRATLDATDQLIGEAQGIAFTVTQAERQFAALYPAAYGGNVTGTQMLAEARQRWSNSLESLRTAIRLQARVKETFAADEAALSDLVTRSQSAAGALQATQATNQLLALSVRENMQAQQLAIAEGRAAALEASRAVAAAERARQVRLTFMGQSQAYNPAPVQLFTR